MSLGLSWFCPAPGMALFTCGFTHRSAVHVVWLTRGPPGLGWLGGEAVTVRESALSMQQRPFLQSFLQRCSRRRTTYLTCRNLVSHLTFGRILLAAIPLTSCNKASLGIRLLQLLKREKKPPTCPQTEENQQPHTTSLLLGCRSCSLPINEAG